MKQVLRYRRKKKGSGLLDHDAAMAIDVEALAARVSYVGSGEHKVRPLDPSFDFSPALRSDASRCDPGVTREQAQAALRQAVRLRCVSEDFVGDFPRYVCGVAGRSAPHRPSRQSGAGRLQGVADRS